MNHVTLATVLITLFWCSFGATFLDPRARVRFYAWVVGWQLFTPQWDFWLDTLLLLGSFTLCEMAYRAVALSVRKDAMPAPVATPAAVLDKPPAEALTVAGD